MLVNDNGCPFCNEFNGHKELSYFEIMIGSPYGITERRVFETKNFVCVPSIGSFVEGYLLVIPKRHYLSTLMLPEDNLKELQLIISVLSNFYKEKYKQSFLIYEHGTSTSEKVGGMSVTHAHLHFLPCSMRIISSLSEFEFLKFESLLAVKDYYSHVNGGPYLLLKDNDNSYYLSITENIPSQYFRKKVCDICSMKGTGNWKEFPYIENIKKTLTATKQFELQKK